MTKFTERDLKFLSILGDFELMTTSQITAHVFAKIDKKTVLRRLRKLECEKLIKRTYGLQTGELVWSLSHYGAYRIHRDGYPENINRNSLEHDITLTELRLTLVSSGIVTSWRSEQSLRRQLAKDKERFGNELCPDAIFAVKTPSGYQGIALELELSGKNTSRYTKVFEAYGQKKNFFALWYVVDSEALGRKLQKVWEKYNPHISRPKFGWILLKELLDAPTEARLFSTTETVKLAALVEIPKSLNATPSKNPRAEAAHPLADRVGNGQLEIAN